MIPPSPVTSSPAAGIPYYPQQRSQGGGYGSSGGPPPSSTKMASSGSKQYYSSSTADRDNRRDPYNDKSQYQSRSGGPRDNGDWDQRDGGDRKPRRSEDRPRGGPPSSSQQQRDPSYGGERQRKASNQGSSIPYTSPMSASQGSSGGPRSRSQGSSQGGQPRNRSQDGRRRPSDGDVVSTPGRRREPSKRAQQPLPLDDPDFEECVEDFLIMFTDEELKAEPYVKPYLQEVLARWGRWTSRGRAPHLCFEAAALGGMRLLEQMGYSASEKTDRVERALAFAMAGLTVDALEPGASVVMREKAVALLGDEFLARAASPKLATPAKKRQKKRRSRYPMKGANEDEWDIDMEVTAGIEQSSLSGVEPRRSQDRGDPRRGDRVKAVQSEGDSRRKGSVGVPIGALGSMPPDPRVGSNHRRRPSDSEESSSGGSSYKGGRSQGEPYYKDGPSSGGNGIEAYRFPQPSPPGASPPTPRRRPDEAYYGADDFRLTEQEYGSYNPKQQQQLQGGSGSPVASPRQGRRPSVPAVAMYNRRPSVEATSAMINSRRPSNDANAVISGAAIMPSIPQQYPSQSSSSNNNMGYNPNNNNNYPSYNPNSAGAPSYGPPPSSPSNQPYYERRPSREGGSGVDDTAFYGRQPSMDPRSASGKELPAHEVPTRDQSIANRPVGSRNNGPPQPQYPQPNLNPSSVSGGPGGPQMIVGSAQMGYASPPQQYQYQTQPLGQPMMQGQGQQGYYYPSNPAPIPYIPPPPAAPPPGGSGGGGERYRRPSEEYDMRGGGNYYSGSSRDDARRRGDNESSGRSGPGGGVGGPPPPPATPPPQRGGWPDEPQSRGGSNSRKPSAAFAGSSGPPPPPPSSTSSNSRRKESRDNTSSGSRSKRSSMTIWDYSNPSGAKFNFTDPRFDSVESDDEYDARNYGGYGGSRKGSRFGDEFDETGGGGGGYYDDGYEHEGGDLGDEDDGGYGRPIAANIVRLQISGHRRAASEGANGGGGGGGGGGYGAPVGRQMSKRRNEPQPAQQRY
ncbi:hypothetical protein HDV05_006600 [Chytridiales sp. JEL 0842]|nr:hypothetical protein HDV05_006600 [Chytridiales sp. JEL 0842]